MSIPAVPARTVRCPTCGTASRYVADNPHRPFCSERCKNLDFGAWASEAFKVQIDPEPPAEDADPPP